MLSPALEHCWKLCALADHSGTGCYCCHSESVQTSPQHPAFLSSPPLIPFTFRLSWQDYCAFSFLLLGVQISELIQAPVALCAHKPCYQLQSWLWLICVSPRLKVTQTVPGSAWAAVCPLPFALQSHVLSLLTQSHQEFFKNIFSDAN